MKIELGLIVTLVFFLNIPFNGLHSQGLFSSFEAGAGLSKTLLVDQDNSFIGTFQMGIDFSKQWQGEVHVNVWESEKFVYDFGISLIKTQMEYSSIFRLGTDIIAGTQTTVKGAQDNWDVDISGGVFYKAFSNEKNLLSIGPEFLYRKTIVGLISESVTSDTIVDPAIHDIFNREKGNTTIGFGTMIKYAYFIKPNFGIYLKGFGRIPINGDSLNFLEGSSDFKRLQTGIFLGMKIRVKQK